MSYKILTYCISYIIAYYTVYHIISYHIYHTSFYISHHHISYRTVWHIISHTPDHIYLLDNNDKDISLCMYFFYVLSFTEWSWTQARKWLVLYLSALEALRMLLYHLRRCTRRSECGRAEEKNGWLWSPNQQCVKIVSFHPPNLSCLKSQQVPAKCRRHNYQSGIFKPDCSALIVRKAELESHTMRPYWWTDGGNTMAADGVRGILFWRRRCRVSQ